MSESTKIRGKSSCRGFTVMELLVVIFMMTVLAGLFTVNLAGQRANRDLKIAQNELVSNVRKIQSYTLSGRLLANSVLAQYYVAKFTVGSDNYVIQAMYKDNSGNWILSDVEKINFPKGVNLDAITITAVDSTITYPSCALVAFASPFAKIYTNDGCNITAPPIVDSASDYNKIVTFVTNLSGQSTKADSHMTLTLKYRQDNSSAKTVNINGVTGLINF